MNPITVSPELAKEFVKEYEGHLFDFTDTPLKRLHSEIKSQLPVFTRQEILQGLCDLKLGEIDWYFNPRNGRVDEYNYCDNPPRYEANKKTGFIFAPTKEDAEEQKLIWEGNWMPKGGDYFCCVNKYDLGKKDKEVHCSPHYGLEYSHVFPSLPQMQSWIERQQVVSDVYVKHPEVGERFYYTNSAGNACEAFWGNYEWVINTFKSQLITRTREGRERIQAKQNAYVELVRLCLQAGGALEWSEEYKVTICLNQNGAPYIKDSPSNIIFFKTRGEAYIFGNTNLHLLNIYYGRDDKG